uniref:Uncharacterized protein n=1 Tax=Prymnesium polylepis TaxID=72548 RepID=A0A7S4HFA7_9EUKA
MTQWFVLLLFTHPLVAGAFFYTDLAKPRVPNAAVSKSQGVEEPALRQSSVVSLAHELGATSWQKMGLVRDVWVKGETVQDKSVGKRRVLSVADGVQWQEMGLARSVFIIGLKERSNAPVNEVVGATPSVVKLGPTLPALTASVYQILAPKPAVAPVKLRVLDKHE